MRRVLKAIGNGVSLAVVSPCALLCWLAKRLRPETEAMFEFWAHVWAMAPGLPGMYLRRAFYRMTLDRCATDWYIGFGSCFTHRTAYVEEGVFVGAYSLIGSAWLHAGCLVGSRASILSGGRQHELGSDGRWTATQVEKLERIDIGEHAWLGEAVVILADVGAGAMVSAGSVVGTRVPEGVLVAGNPARFVRRLVPNGTSSSATASENASRPSAVEQNAS